MESFPVGFRFHPTDTELVSHYLRNKDKLGDGFRPPYVSDCPEIYSTLIEPWNIWEKYGGNSVEDGEPLFVFTKRKKLNPQGTRFDRKVGTGTWSGQNCKEVMEEDNIIGIKRNFRYEGGSSPDQNAAWLMDEYELNKTDVTVLCVLRKNYSTKPPPKKGNETKRKLEDVVDDIEQDIDQRRKLIRDLDQRRKLLGNYMPGREGTWEEVGTSSSVDHHQASSSWTPTLGDYRTELAPDVAGADDDFVFYTHELLGCNKYLDLDLFYESTNFDSLTSQSFK